jgi:uncharacterized protein YodC (DUF2158 family)
MKRIENVSQGSHLGFKKGDVVQLNSCGPDMTVEEVGERNSFPPKVLESAGSSVASFGRIEGVVGHDPRRFYRD